jgi:capsular exopolysaccharide synthesis family protein
MSRLAEALQRAGVAPGSGVAEFDDDVTEAGESPAQPEEVHAAVVSDFEPVASLIATDAGAQASDIAADADAQVSDIAADAYAQPSDFATHVDAQVNDIAAEAYAQVSDIATGPDAQARDTDESVPGPDVGGLQAIFQGFEPQVSERLVVTESIPTVSLEQYRNLAAVLHHAQVDRGIKVVMVASALAGEGKTLTTVNLALTLSGSYRRSVLIIDGDLRKPSMHSIFQVPNTSGLSDAFKSDKPRKVKVFEISPNLSLLTAGPPGPDPMSLLTSERIRTLLREAAHRYDWVIIDTPPVGLLTDANLLGVMIDASVLVVRAGVTPHRLIQRAAEMIGRDRIVGVVLNAVEPQALAGSRYYPDYYGRQAAAAH